MHLRANTAVDILIGPFVDSTDGNTVEDGLTINQADVRLSKNGQNMAQKNDANVCTHDELGYYNCPLDATDTNTEGELIVAIHSAGARPVRLDFNILSEAAWDSLYLAKDDGYIDVNIKAISEDTVAADNLELQFDGTGYVDDTAPSTQAQLSNIANVGSAVNKAADSYVLTTGTQSANTVADTVALNGTRHTHTDDGGSIDLYYEFLIGGGTPSTVKITGRLTGGNDDLKIYGYDWVATSWVQIGTLEGTSSSVNAVFDYDLFVAMVGVGSDFGKVRIRFYDDTFTLTSATLYVDQIFVSYSQGSGDYALGAIWVDTNFSNTNTVPGVDGVSTNPVSTWAAALTLSAKLNIKKFELTNGSSITLAASSDNYKITGYGATVDLNGQSISGVFFEGCSITGNDDGSNSIPARLKNCSIGNCTLGKFRMNQCPLTGTITLAEAGTYILEQCLCSCQSGTNPVIDFGVAVGNTTVSIRHWSGSMEYQNMGQSGTDITTIHGWGQVIVNANCIGGTIGISGNMLLTNNGSATVNDNSRIDVGQINVECDTALADYDPPTRTELTSDKDEIITQVNANETKIDSVQGNVTSILEDTGTTIPAQITGISAGDATEAKQDTIITHLTEVKGATFATGTDSLEAIRDRGDSAWTTGGGLSGSNAIVITVQDALAANIVECAVEIWDSAGTTFYERQTTDASGQVTSNLDDGTYTVKMHKAGYTFTNQTLVVSGASSETYTGTALTPSTPSDPSECQVYEWIRDTGAGIPTSVTATATIVDLPYDSGSLIHVGTELSATYDTVTGYLYWDIVQGATVHFSVPDYGINTQKEIPSSTTARLIDIE